MKAVFSSKKNQLLFFGLTFVFWFAILLPLGPCSDDWYYQTTPDVDFSLSQLLPTGTFWRPFDALFGALLGLCPALFPYLNHFAVTFGHVLSCYILLNIFRSFYKFNDSSALIAVIFYLFSSGNFAAVANIDSLNQIYSQLFGILGFWCYIKYKSSNSKFAIPYFLCCALATFTKESGIVYGVLIPVLYNLNEFTDLKLKTLSSAFKKVIKDELIYLLFAAAYFICRMLGGSGISGDSSYSISLNPVSVIKNVFMMLSGSLTSIDSVALFAQPRNLVLFAVTLILNVPFLLFIAIGLLKLLFNKKTGCKTLVLLLLACACMAPNVLITVGEMHAYGLFFWVALIIAYVINQTGVSRKVFVTAFALFMAASAITGVHKWLCMKAYSNNSDIVVEQIAESYKDEAPPEKVLILRVRNQTEGYYSVYVQPVAEASYYGYAAKQLWDWEYPAKIKVKTFKNTDEATVYIKTEAADEEYNGIWLVESNGSFKRIK